MNVFNYWRLVPILFLAGKNKVKIPYSEFMDMKPLYPSGQEVTGVYFWSQNGEQGSPAYKYFPPCLFSQDEKFHTSNLILQMGKPKQQIWPRVTLQGGGQPTSQEQKNLMLQESTGISCWL